VRHIADLLPYVVRLLCSAIISFYFQKIYKYLADRKPLRANSAEPLLSKNITINITVQIGGEDKSNLH
jgi:hypothetical protein